MLIAVAAWHMLSGPEEKTGPVAGSAGAESALPAAKRVPTGETAASGTRPSEPKEKKDGTPEKPAGKAAENDPYNLGPVDPDSPAAGYLEAFNLLDIPKDPEEWLKLSFENSGIENMITHEEFKKKGYFVIPTDPDWEKVPAGLKGFHDDPDNHPLNTPSGRIEFCSQNLTKHFPDDKERPPVPHWIEKGESHDERLSSERAKKYPLLMMSNHGRWRVHAQCDDISWTREAPTCKVLGADGYMYEPCWINPGDAGKRGIRHGDVVRVYNERGIVLAGAYVTERMMPGVVYMDHGARYDPVVPGELDRGGAINTITPHNLTSKNATGMVVSSFLVEVAGENLDELMRQYPEAFGREYDPASGLRLERVMEK